ncbi:carboxypeptidase-like regulatory domain-containing protein [Catalinimonas niigatensis]|uniref:carboxypeptidase-like regulatory domain-containing protein n=1 Tax=Catalinimonas niigatensis TaxID=1397264 RepID=UPI002665416F|nr:carboxypeptidase-like regulatory domain-containing protein [Catalinimonas niigatensis]WPP49256.1 carboxypeptidase-like regulatory domain-containing protein [Catalinimonas niigatensis]
MKKLIYMLPTLGMLIFLLAFHAPEATISGKVTSGSEALPGVDVSVQGSNQGTVTNMQGNYSLEVGNDADTLVFSSLGYQTQKVAIGGKTTINIQLKEE